MSEQILKALMRLFAIMARPDTSPDEKRFVVSSFLNQQLNKELVDQYLKVFDDYFKGYQEKYDSERAQIYYSASAVKVLKIGNQINRELTHDQKIIVLIRLMEFAKAEGEVSAHEKEVIDTIADVFHVATEEYRQLIKFVVDYFDEPDDIEDILIVDNLKDTIYKKVKHLYFSQLKGQMKFYYIRSAGMYIFNFFGENELSMNGQFLQQTKVYIFSTGSSIRSAHTPPIFYSDIVNAYNRDDSKFNTIFEANNIEFKFSNDTWGFHKMNFVERSGRLIGIMGASGTGKTTLLNVLNGTNQPTSGHIAINGIKIHKEKEKTKGIIGYVSQDDLLIEELSVFENLYYNAKLSFSNVSDKEIATKVNTLLENVGLIDVANHKVGSILNKVISGGQRKRLNIALELIREPTILFLDEPTSGLSSKDSEKIMDLLKELTLKGKLVFIVIHQPSSAIFKMFDRLYVLDQGGYLVYRGDPVDSISYFKSRVHQADWNEAECHVCGNVTPEQIFNIIEAEVVDEYGNLTHTRKTSPKEWNVSFRKYIKEETVEHDEYLGLPPVSYQPPNWLEQLKIFTTRDFKAKWTNRGALFLNILLAPVLAFILTYIVKYYNITAKNASYFFSENNNIPVYLFMAVIVALFMGLTGSAQEIIKDRKILKREKFLNLSWSSYLVSKLAILLAVSAIQALLFVLLGNQIVELKGMFFPYWVVLFSVWSFGVILGLNVSDGVKKEITIYILIPFLIIPQIVLSGVIIRFDRLNPHISSPENIPWYGEIMAARWGYEALAVHLFVYNKFEAPIYQYHKQMSNCQYKTDIWIPELKRKVHFIKQNYTKEKRMQEIEHNLVVLRNAIQEEQKLNNIITVSTDQLQTNTENFMYLVKQLSLELEALRIYYNQTFLKANRAAEARLDTIDSEEERAYFVRLKKEHVNKEIKRMLKHTEIGSERFVEYKGKLIKKVDPIYQDPEHPFLRAHFYAPRKLVFNVFIETLWANVLALWVMFLGLYALLYFRTFSRLSNWISESKCFKQLKKAIGQ